MHQSGPQTIPVPCATPRGADRHEKNYVLHNEPLYGSAVSYLANFRKLHDGNR